MAAGHDVVGFDSMEQTAAVFGTFDENLRYLETKAEVTTRAAGSGLEVTGDAPDVARAVKALGILKQWFAAGEPIVPDTVSRALDLVDDNKSSEASRLSSEVIAVTASGRPIKARTFGQKRYVEAIRNHTLTLCVGPAGTGKTYLAVALAVLALKNKQVSRIILTRPAVEAGENLGFLPGDLQTKVDPYLRPLYDALYDFLGAEAYGRLIERAAIEVAPLAYMRGRTLNDAFIILDEAQNCTNEQMKMFLTRFGEDSKVVVTGDVTQIDLPKENSSGLKRALKILDGIEDIAVTSLSHKDVVRHPLVKKIVRAYEKFEKSTQSRPVEVRSNG